MRYSLLRITALAFLIVAFSLPCRAAETGAQSVDSSWIKAMKANDLEAVLKTYAPRVVVWLPQGKEARGEKAIRSVYEGLLSANTVTEMVLSETGYRTMGKVSVGWGRFSLTLAPVGRQSSCDDRKILRHSRAQRWPLGLHRRSRVGGASGNRGLQAMKHAKPRRRLAVERPRTRAAPLTYSGSRD